MNQLYDESDYIRNYDEFISLIKRAVSLCIFILLVMFNPIKLVKEQGCGNFQLF